MARVKKWDARERLGNACLSHPMVIIKSLDFAHLYTALVLAILLLHTFYPKAVNVDRFTVTFLVLLFFMLILPTLVSGKVSYLFEFKRDLGRLNESVKRLKEKDGARDASLMAGVAQEIRNGTKAKNICYTTGAILVKIESLLETIFDKKFSPEKRKNLKSSLELTDYLKSQKIISEELAEALEKTLTICTPLGYHSQLKAADVEEIVEATLPIIQRLSEISLSA